MKANLSTANDTPAAKGRRRFEEKEAQMKTANGATAEIAKPFEEIAKPFEETAKPFEETAKPLERIAEALEWIVKYMKSNQRAY